MKKIFYLITLSFIPATSFAEGVTKLASPTPGVGTLFDFVTAILNIVIKISIPVVSLAFIWTGYLFVSANGVEAKITEAKYWLYKTVIATAIIFGAVVIATIVKNTIGLLGG